MILTFTQILFINHTIAKRESDWRGIDMQAGNGNDIHDNTHDYDTGIVTDTETTIYVLQNIRNDGITSVIRL